MKTVRCAIYTRKSSEEGLEQDFNSLDAQRESCAAYILSQASEGWSALPDIYDDGGLSGGTLDRPALQRLLSEVTAGRVDIIVVYKVDRLTRSLLDFSKLVEAFDKAGTSFVSVTQSFNTTTSMGRLTLNMLLSFAQFEREVTAERIRDKIAASKARGMWMGATPPIGYEPDGRTLKIVESHAKIVRHIYDRYLELGNVRLVADELARDGIGSPARVSINNKRRFGGVPFSRGQIYSMLKSRTYNGEIHHHGNIYKALHKPIIDRDQWERVQAMLGQHLVGDRRSPRVAHPSLLAGLIVDEADQPLIATHACKGRTRYRYYVSQAGHHLKDPSQHTTRIPARELETAVIECLADALADPIGLLARASLALPASDFARLVAAGMAASDAVRQRRTATIQKLVAHVRVSSRSFELTLSTQTLAETFGVPTDDSTEVVIPIPVRVTRTGRSMRLVQGDGRLVAATNPDATLVKLLIKARRWWRVLRDGELDITALAKREGVTASYLTRIVRLAFLSPVLIDEVLAGRQIASLNGDSIKGHGPLPASWSQQQRLLG